MSIEFEELEKIVSEEAGVEICPICKTPFYKRDARQRTCGTNECKRLWKNKYLRERRLRLIAEDKEWFNFQHAEAQRKSRHKKRAKQIAWENAKDDTIGEKNIERLESFFVMKTPADEYAERQIKKTLALVPKIDVNLDRGKKNDDLHDKNE